MKIIKYAITLILILACMPSAYADPDVQALLQASDRARAGNLPGLVWDVQAIDSGSAVINTDTSILRVKAAGTSSLAEYLSPPRSKGSRMLQVDRNMWFTKHGLRKPVAISPRQRLTGQAAIGDIAATNYVEDYTAKYVREENFNGEPCYVLDLTAAKNNTTYDRITYWISVQRQVGVHAEFLSVSGKRLKQADFFYDNTIDFEGSAFPFISKMTISDVLTDAVTTLEYSNIKVKQLPNSVFDVANLQ